MKFLHTADWHIGQLFYEYDRTWEHEKFLDWLVDILQTEAIDVLLISGDVFDVSNPSAASIRLFYTFLSRAIRVSPELQIIVTAGNHDSATRLEAPKPLLESSNIHLVGVIERDMSGGIDYTKLAIPLKDNAEVVKGWCLAIPFLRMGDYPVIEGSESPYGDGVASVYAEAYRYVAERKQPGQWVIALGHMHTQAAESSDMDRAERLIMGGAEFVPISAFHDDLYYVALGHIHRAQRVGAREHIRYSGSPLPMSFSERSYRHQVVVFELNASGMEHLRLLEVPVAVPLLRAPAVHSRVAEVIGALARLPVAAEGVVEAYLEVLVLADGPDPGLKNRVLQAVAGKAVKLARIDICYTAAAGEDGREQPPQQDDLAELRPVDVFAKTYEARYGATVPENLLRLFQAIAAEIDENG